LLWDGTARIDRWLTTYAGAPDTPLNRSIGALWLIGAAARIYKPGCKADCILIFEGPQGTLKSTLLKTICGASWFTDEIADLGSKDASMQVAGVWIIELAELDSMSRADTGRIKAFISRAADRFRPPYGKNLIEAPRQVSFAGTVNHQAYLKDETGARRFWPVQCGVIDIPQLAADRDQLWAETVARYKAGAKWWLDTTELESAAAAAQAERYEADAWDELIAEWLPDPTQRSDSTGHPITPFTSTRESVTTADVLTHAIGKRADQWSQADANRVARSLRSMNWERFKKRVGKGFQWRYRHA